jgi:hypothetical protein
VHLPYENAVGDRLPAGWPLGTFAPQEVSMKTNGRRHRFLVSWLLALTATLAFSCAHAQTEIPVSPLDVNVVNQPQVNIINTIKNPLPVGDVQNPAFNPFQVDARFSLGRGQGAGEAVLPGVGRAGQRVVIEHVTVGASIPDGQRVVAYIKLGEIEHSLVLTFQGDWGSSQRFRASQPIKLYSVGGADGIALAGVERSGSAGSASFYFTVSGYLVDLP